MYSALLAEIISKYNKGDVKHVSSENYFTDLTTGTIDTVFGFEDWYALDEQIGFI